MPQTDRIATMGSRARVNLGTTGLIATHDKNIADLGTTVITETRGQIRSYRVCLGAI